MISDLGMLALSVLTPEQREEVQRRSAEITRQRAEMARQRAEEECRTSGHVIEFKLGGDVPRCNRCGRPASEIIPRTPPERRRFTLAEAAELLGVNAETVRRVLDSM